MSILNPFTNSAAVGQFVNEYGAGKTFGMVWDLWETDVISDQQAMEVLREIEIQTYHTTTVYSLSVALRTHIETLIDLASLEVTA